MQLVELRSGCLLLWRFERIGEGEMTQDELETLLRRWGRVFGERPAPDPSYEDERPAAASHPIARGMETAPKRKSEWLRQKTSLNRAGQDRRAYMAAVAASGVRGGIGLRIVPATFVDAIPCVETRSYRSEARDWPVPVDVSKVERAALDLKGFAEIRYDCLRITYCTLPTGRGHREKAAKLGLKLKSFRDELAAARLWLHGRLTA